MLVLRYLLRSSVPVTGKTVRSKIYEILDFLELRAFTGQGFTFTTIGCKGADGPTKEQCLAEYNFDLADHELPLTESLQDCMDRARPIWEDKISYELRKGHTVLVIAHANIIRGFVKEIDSEFHSVKIVRLCLFDFNLLACAVCEMTCAYGYCWVFPRGWIHICYHF